MPKNIQSRLKGQVQFDQSIEKVWAFFMTPSLVSNCTPGLSNWAIKVPNQTFDLLFVWETPAQTKLIFPTQLSWQDIQPPQQLNFTAVTESKGFGTIQFSGTLKLVNLEVNKTDLEFTAVIQTNNPFINQLIKNALLKQIDQFFRCIKTKI